MEIIWSTRHGSVERKDVKVHATLFICAIPVSLQHVFIRTSCEIHARFMTSYVLVLCLLLGISFMFYKGVHEHGAIDRKAKAELSEERKQEVLLYLSDKRPRAAYSLYVKAYRDKGWSESDIAIRLPSYSNFRALRQSNLKCARECAEAEVINTFQSWPSDDPFLQELCIFDIQDSKQVKEKALFAVLMDHRMASILVEYGNIVANIDGMHNINRFRNNQLVTISCKLGDRSYIPCAYLITNRYCPIRLFVFSFPRRHIIISSICVLFPSWHSNEFLMAFT